MPTFSTADIVAFAALIVSALSIIFNYLQNKANNQHTFVELIKRWELDQKSKQAELDIKQKQEEAESKAKAQAELNSLYTNAIASLSAAALTADVYGKSTQLVDSLKKAQYDVSQLLIHHYDKGGDSFQEINRQLREMSYDRAGIEEVGETLKNVIIEMMNNDPRLAI